MNEFLLMIILLAAVAVFCATMAIYYFYKLKTTSNPVGALKVDRSDPDGPYIFLELYTDVNHLCKKKRVILEVDLKNCISQK